MRIPSITNIEISVTVVNDQQLQVDVHESPAIQVNLGDSGHSTTRHESQSIAIQLNWDDVGRPSTPPEFGFVHKLKDYEFISHSGAKLWIHQNGAIKIAGVNDEQIHLKLAAPRTVNCCHPIKLFGLSISAEDLVVQKVENGSTLIVYENLDLNITKRICISGTIELRKSRQILGHPNFQVQADSVEFFDQGGIQQTNNADANLDLSATKLVMRDTNNVFVNAVNLHLTSVLPVALRGNFLVPGQLKVDAPNVHFQGRYQSPKITIKTDHYAAEPYVFRADKFKLQGYGSTQCACSNILSFHPILSYSGVTIPSKMSLRIAEQSVLTATNTNTNEILKIKTSVPHSPCAIDTTGEYRLQLKDPASGDFVVNHPQKSAQSLKIECPGKNLSIIGEDPQLLVVEAMQGLYLKSNSAVVKHAKVTGLEKIELQVAGTMTVDGTKAIRPLGKQDLSPHVQRQGAIADSHARTLSQYSQTASDGTALISGKDLVCDVGQFVFSHCGVFAPGSFSGNVREGSVNLSSVMFFGDTNLLTQPMLTLKVNTIPAISTKEGSREILGSNYITSPQPSILFAKPNQINYSIRNLGGELISQSDLTFNAPHKYEGVNVAPIETWKWQEFSFGHRKYRICGRKKKKTHYPSENHYAQIGDQPSKPYIARRCVEGHLQLNNLSDYSQGQTQAVNISGNPNQFKLDFPASATQVKKHFANEVNLETYIERFSQLTIPGDSSLYRLPAELVRCAEQRVRTVLYREAASGPITEDRIRQKYSEEITDLLTRFALMDVLGRSYTQQNETPDQLRENGVNYALTIPANADRPNNEALLLSAEDIQRANQSFIYYIEKVLGSDDQVTVVPKLHLSPILQQSMQHCTGVSYMRADKNIELVHRGGQSVIECMGIMEADTIKLSADYIKLIQRTRKANTKADLNKRNRNLTVEFDQVDEQAGKIKANNQIIIDGKQYFQLGGSLESGQGGTFVKMEESIHLQALQGSELPQGEHLTRGGKNYALKPEFFKAKVISAGNQKFSGGTILMQGAMLNATGSNDLEASGDIIFKPISATYHGPSYKKGKIFKTKKSTTQDSVAGNVFSAGKKSTITSTNGNVLAEYTQFRTDDNLDISANNIEIFAAYCRTTVRQSQKNFTGLTYSDLSKQGSRTEALLCSAYIGGHLSLRARDKIGLTALQGLIGGDLNLQAKIIKLSAAKETNHEKMKRRSVSVHFFGSEAIEGLFQGKSGDQVLNSLMGDVPFIKSVQDICMSEDGADLSIASIKAFYDAVSLASMAKTAMNTDSPFASFCGEFTDSLGITKVNQQTGAREFNPSVGLKYRQTTQTTEETDEIATRLKVQGTVEIKGDTVILEGGCQIKAQDIIILAKKFNIACGQYTYKRKTNMRGVGVSAQVRDGANVSASVEAQSSSATQQIHHMGLLQAENSIYIDAEESVNITGSRVEALKTFLRSRVVTISSVQDKQRVVSIGGGLGVGITAPKIDASVNISSRKEAIVKDMATLCGEQSLEILAEKIVQVGSLIDAPGTLNVTHLTGKPIIAVTNDLDDADDDNNEPNHRAYYFVTAKLPGTPLKTILQACESNEAALISVLTLIRLDEERHILRKSFCECLPIIAKNNELFSVYPNLSAFQDELINEGTRGAERVFNSLSEDDKQNCSRQFIETIRNNPNLLQMSLELTAFVTSKLHPNAVIWQLEDDPDHFVKVHGNDQAVGAIHICINQDGSCSRLLRTNNTTQLVDWSIEDIKDYQIYKELSVSSSVFDRDFTAGVKAKQSVEHQKVRSSVFTGQNLGQSIPIAANQNPDAIRETTKSKSSGVGFFVDNKRLSELDSLVSPKPTTAKPDPNSLEWRDAFDAYFEYVAEKVHGIVVQSNLPFEKNAVDKVIARIVDGMEVDEIQPALRSLPSELMEASEEFRRFSKKENSKDESQDPTTTALMWMALENLQNNPEKYEEKYKQDFVKLGVKATSAISKTVSVQNDKNGIPRKKDEQGRFRRGLLSTPSKFKKGVEKFLSAGSQPLYQVSESSPVGKFTTSNGAEVTVSGNKQDATLTALSASVAFTGLAVDVKHSEQVSTEISILKGTAKAAVSLGFDFGAEAVLAEVGVTAKVGEGVCVLNHYIEPYVGAQIGLGWAEKRSAGFSAFKNGKGRFELSMKRMLEYGGGVTLGAEITLNSERCKDTNIVDSPKPK